MTRLVLPWTDFYKVYYHSIKKLSRDMFFIYTNRHVEPVFHQVFLDNIYEMEDEIEELERDWSFYHVPAPRFFPTKQPIWECTDLRDLSYELVFGHLNMNIGEQMGLSQLMVINRNGFYQVEFDVDLEDINRGGSFIQSMLDMEFGIKNPTFLAR